MARGFHDMYAHLINISLLIMRSLPREIVTLNFARFALSWQGCGEEACIYLLLYTKR